MAAHSREFAFRVKAHDDGEVVDDSVDAHDDAVDVCGDMPLEIRLLALLGLLDVAS